MMSEQHLHGADAETRGVASLELQRFELPQEAHVVFREQAQVLNLIFQHGYALDAHAPGIAGILLGVDFGVFEYGGVYHAAATDFYPARVLANVAARAL